MAVGGNGRQIGLTEMVPVAHLVVCHRQWHTTRCTQCCYLVVYAELLLVLVKFELNGRANSLSSACIYP